MRYFAANSNGRQQNSVLQPALNRAALRAANRLMILEGRAFRGIRPQFAPFSASRLAPEVCFSLSGFFASRLFT